MKIVLVILSLILFFFVTRLTFADDVAGKSATITYSQSTNYCFLPPINLAQKRKAIKNILEKYGSPLVNSVDDFVDACSKYNIDCYLLPSIAGVESTFGKFVPRGSNNGWGWGGGRIHFASWGEGIDKVGRVLKYNYIEKGADTLDKIGIIYSESRAWTPHVNYFLREFEREETKLNETQPHFSDSLL